MCFFGGDDLLVGFMVNADSILGDLRLMKFAHNDGGCDKLLNVLSGWISGSHKTEKR